MKNIFLLISIFLISVFFNTYSNAQNFSFTPLGSASVNYPYIPDSTQVVKLQGIVRNTSSSPVNFRFARIYNNLPANWETQMCYDLCYAPFIDTISLTSDPPYNITPNHTDTLFYIDFTCSGQGLGTANVKMYNTDNPSEFVMISFNVRIGDVGIQTITSGADNYSLSQNFPNPFNPSTQINFSISKSDIVTLKVFDILGKEVAVLLNNERINSGKYKIDFDGSRLSSGIYYYSIFSNNFYDTKKMTILK